MSRATKRLPQSLLNRNWLHYQDDVYKYVRWAWCVLDTRIGLLSNRIRADCLKYLVTEALWSYWVPTSVQTRTETRSWISQCQCRRSFRTAERVGECGIQITSISTIDVKDISNIFLLSASTHQAVSLRVLSFAISSVTRTSWLPSSSDNTTQVGKTHNTVMPKLIPMLTKWFAPPSDCILLRLLADDAWMLFKKKKTYAQATVWPNASTPLRIPVRWLKLERSVAYWPTNQ